MAKIAVCFTDTEYQNRLVGYLMKHDAGRLQLYIFGSAEDICAEADGAYDVYLLEGDMQQIRLLCDAGKSPIVFLTQEDTAEEEEKDVKESDDKEGVFFTQKYQDVKNLTEEMLSHLSGEIRPKVTGSFLAPSAKLQMIYSLSQGDGQLPFALALSSVLAEKKRVLLLDLQEDSGFSRLIVDTGKMGLEEMLLMAEEDNVKKGRMIGCIGHRDGLDFVYPPACIDNLLEVDARGYLRLLRTLSEELDYDVILLNAGTRFPGFLDVVGLCERIYLLRRKENAHFGQWREEAFLEELTKKGDRQAADRMCFFDLPAPSRGAATLEKAVQEYKHGEAAERIRQLCRSEEAYG